MRFCIFNFRHFFTWWIFGIVFARVHVCECAHVCVCVYCLRPSTATPICTSSHTHTECLRYYFCYWFHVKILFSASFESCEQNAWPTHTHTTACRSFFPSFHYKLYMNILGNKTCTCLVETFAIAIATGMHRNCVMCALSNRSDTILLIFIPIFDGRIVSLFCYYLNPP